MNLAFGVRPSWPQALRRVRTSWTVPTACRHLEALRPGWPHSGSRAQSAY